VGRGGRVVAVLAVAAGRSGGNCFPQNLPGPERFDKRGAVLHYASATQTKVIQSQVLTSHVKDTLPLQLAQTPFV